MNYITVMAFVLMASVNALAQDSAASNPTKAVDESSLEDLLSMKTSVATKRETSARSAPGIVSIITDADIRNMGAVDLIDVLRLVPSLNFGTDVQGVIGLGVRGMWAHEGKFLLIIDGIEMNEIQYGTTQFGSHYPVSQIKRIEIIRGPGSVIYGGFAELAVINIVTKSGPDLNGAEVRSTYGQMAKGSERKKISASFGKANGDYEYSFSASTGSARRGEGQYTGAKDDQTAHQTYDLKDGDEIRPSYVNAGLSTEALKLRFIFDEYQSTTRTWYGYNGKPDSIQNNFRSVNFAGSYKLILFDNLTVTPYAHFYMQAPWNQATADAQALLKWSDVRSTRGKYGFTAAKELSSGIDLLAGYEYIRDRNTIRRSLLPSGADSPFNNGGHNFSLYSHSMFAQAQYPSEYGIWTAGARFENPSRTQSSFAPRIGFTKETKSWHSKFLLSNSFRAPVLYNLDLKPGILPEKTQTTELEFGLALTPKTYATANVYYTKVKDPIVYYYDTADRYDNFGTLATKGFELDTRQIESWGELRLSYAYYEVDTNKVSKYQLATNDDALLGMPQHQVVANGVCNLGNEIKFGPTFVYHGEQYAFEADTPTNSMVERKLPAVILTTLSVSKQNLFTKGLGTTLGVSNLFNNDVRYVQPYNGGHAPLPGPSREVYAQVEYQTSF